MRIMIKGGVWKNTEDEILKAAVMKYGKNQWSRISSLLVRKSAKQCKARWYEWLDPSIKKTEWTREEDEKLLHLAKLMPTQWRTIAPIVGRTPAQCLERYEKLLDAACSRDDAAAAGYDASDDPRRLRPGEIDPNPEAKPARPDPVDMDEDEKEMLSEARARLANTRGKKAKRKAREKQLEEARRLASLQKRRELKAAGLEANYRRRKNKGIDYNAEIPFEKKPPPGFFDTSGEDANSVQPMRFPVTQEELEGKRRADVEAAARKHDAAANKMRLRHDAPASVLQVNQLNDPAAVRKRSKLSLPAPQISDAELAAIAKMTHASHALAAAEDGDPATRALLASYGQTPAHAAAAAALTPLRTPQRTPGGKGDAIMMEAENLARLRDTQTPLFGGQNPDLHPSDFSGITPRKKEAHTPNPLATPFRTPGTAVGMTPGGLALTGGGAPGSVRGASVGGTPGKDSVFGATPSEGMVTPGGESARAERLRQAEVRESLRQGLGSLPAPKNEYSIVVPELPEDDAKDGARGDGGEGEVDMELDMSEVHERRESVRRAAEEERLRKRSQVLQRELPRPAVAAVKRLVDAVGKGGGGGGAGATLMERAEEMVRAELALLLQHDAVAYPAQAGDDGAGGGRERKRKKGGRGEEGSAVALAGVELADVEHALLMQARALLSEEAGYVRMALGQEDAAADEFIEAWEGCVDDLVFLPAQGAWGLASLGGSADVVAAQRPVVEGVGKAAESEGRRCSKLEHKVKVMSHGYQSRAEALWKQVESAHREAGTLATELQCFRALHAQEVHAAPTRIETLQRDVGAVTERERALQLRYENLLVARQHWRKVVGEGKQRQAQEQATRAAAAEAKAEAEAAAEREKERKLKEDREREEEKKRENEKIDDLVGGENERTEKVAEEQSGGACAQERLSGEVEEQGGGEAAERSRAGGEKSQEEVRNAQENQGMNVKEEGEAMEGVRKVEEGEGAA
ncbi:hypothetical protein CLOM_g24080 [Closterium sp. NIES-68]|nr:hypothetical protein CLOM_g24080 [Closterium sp. NIES-68]